MATKFLRIVRLMTLVICCSMVSANTMASPSVAGYWRVKSPLVSPQPLGIVKLYIVKGELFGQLLRVFPLNGRIIPSRTAKSGPVVMYGYKKKGNRWVGGKLYEQTTAKIYSSELWLSKDGRHLNVRGHKGPFYRTAVWDRA